MNPTLSAPATVLDISDLHALQRAARRCETDCGEGSIVWHLWGTGDPLVLLHGGSGSWTHWVRNVGALVNQGYQVLAPDLPGFGDSSVTPDGRDGDAMPRWLEAGLTDLVGSGRCPLVGFSFGAMVGTLWACDFPERVSAVVLVGAPALSDIPMPKVGLKVWEKLPQGDARAPIHRHNLNALMLANAESVDALSVHIHAANVERDRLRRRRLARTDIVLRTIPQLQCPVAGIWGEHDAVYENRGHTIEPALRQAADFRGLTYLPDTGHWAQYESAELFNATLTEVLREFGPAG